MEDDEVLGLEALRSENVWAVVGAGQDPERYGHKLLAALRAAGKRVLPVNPRYPVIDGLPCHASLEALPVSPDAVLLALSPEDSAAAVVAMPRLGALVWLPPGCWSEEALQACGTIGLRIVYDICPIALLLKARLDGPGQAQPLSTGHRLSPRATQHDSDRRPLRR